MGNLKVFLILHPLAFSSTRILPLRRVCSVTWRPLNSSASWSASSLPTSSLKASTWTSTRGGSFGNTVCGKQYFLPFFIKARGDLSTFLQDISLCFTTPRAGFKGRTLPDLQRQETTSLLCSLRILYKIYSDMSRVDEWTKTEIYLHRSAYYVHNTSIMYNTLALFQDDISYISYISYIYECIDCILCAKTI